MKWKAGQLFFKPQSPTVINRVVRTKGATVWYLPNHYGANPPRGTLRKADAAETIAWVQVPRTFAAPHTEQGKLNDHLVITARIECCLCSEQHEGEEHMASDVGSVVQDAAEYFHSLGWREQLSAEFQTVGAMCPDCATKGGSR